MKTYTSQEWFRLAKDLYDLIVIDIEKVTVNSLPEIYPKLVVMYEFFRLIRGEAFNSTKPEPMLELQKGLYDMEYDLSERLKPLEKQLNIEDGNTSYNLDLMKKSFSLKYFNNN